MCSISFIFRIIHGNQLLGLPFWIISYYDLYRVKNGTYTNGTTIQIIANSTLQQSDLIEGIISGIANLIDKLHYTFRTISTTTETTYCRHTGVIPSVDKAFIHQSKQISFRHQCIGEVQFIELSLTRTVIFDIVRLTFVFFYPCDK